MSDKPPLNADELGEKGESRFREICADANLNCNPSIRDRTGWDFIVEFAHDNNETSTLDKRPAPISCHVQLKTMWAWNDAFQMRLSSAERLAKDTKPTFIYIFKVSKELEFVEAHLIHLFDDALAAILKQLRNEQVKGKRSVNKKILSFKASKNSLKIAPTGAALRETIVRVCGSDQHAYVNKKLSQLNSLGFDEPRFEGNFTLKGAIDDKLADVFLGKEKAEVTSFNVFEKRFGINLPASPRPFTKGVLSITPHASDTCKIIIHEGLNPPAIFEAEIYSTPRPLAPLIGIKALVKSKFFEIEITVRNQEISGSFTTDRSDVFSKPQDIQTWIMYLQLLRAMSKGNSTLTIEPTKTPKLTVPLPHINPEAAGEIEKLQRLFQAAKLILEAAGLLNKKFLVREIWEQAKDIQSLSALIRGDSKTGSFTTQNTNPDVKVQEKPEKGLILNCLQFGGTLVGYSATAIFSPTIMTDSINWNISDIALEKIRKLNSIDDFSAFAAEEKKMNLPFLFQRSPENKQT